MLFNRQVIVQIGTAGSEGKSFEGLKVTFKVKMTRKGTPNDAVIEVYNVNPDTVALAQNPDAVIRLLAGYDVPQLLFAGNPTKGGVKLEGAGAKAKRPSVSLERKGADRVLTIEAQDGLRAYQSARVSVSYTTETTLQQVYTEVAAQLGLPEGTIRVDSTFRFTQGGVFSGYARDVLDRIAASTASGWFIRDGTLQLVGAAEDTGEQAVVFSSKAGAKNLIGSPTRTNDGVEITGLLAPTLRPGKPFRVESADITGDFTADVVEFDGDSRDGPFYVRARGLPRS